MKSDYTFRGKMCLLSAMLLASTLPVNAKSLTIETETEGTLAEKISETDKWEVTELKVSGPLNAFDFRTLREMSGCDLMGEPTEGKLKNSTLPMPPLSAIRKNSRQMTKATSSTMAAA